MPKKTPGSGAEPRVKIGNQNFDSDPTKTKSLTIMENKLFKYISSSDKHTVYLIGDCTDWIAANMPYDKAQKAYCLNIYLEPGIYEYRFIVDGKNTLDPNNSSVNYRSSITNNLLEVKQIAGFSNKIKQFFATPAKKTNDEELKLALASAQKMAMEGEKKARQNISRLQTIIHEISQAILSVSNENQKSAVEDGKISDEIKKQLNETSQKLTTLPKTMQMDLVERRKLLDTFSIVVFGRTMAGKSTLMESLMHNDGTSIGHGRQRTTRDIREYKWKNLKVIDVPGIGAADGEVDETVAFEAAKKADLILFLITDDAPQPVEAERLNDLRNLGKPVFGIINIKLNWPQSLDDEEVELFFEDLNGKFSGTQIKEIIQQFNSFLSSKSQGMYIGFTPVHLLSNFLSEQPQCAKYSKQLHEASRFYNIQTQIIKEITHNGCFFRQKSFLDAAIKPMTDFAYSLLDYSESNASNGRIFLDKQRKLNTWTENFKATSVQKIQNQVSTLISGLRSGISNFAEDFYESSNVNAAWSKHIEGTGFKNQLQALANSLSSACKEQVDNLTRELQNEVKFVAKFTEDNKISMPGITDGKRIWNWGKTIISGGLGIAALICSGPVGWGLGIAAVAVGILGWLGSFFFDDREEKVRRAREKLKSKLNDNLDSLEKQSLKTLNDFLFNDLLKGGLYPIIHELKNLTGAYLNLATQERKLAQNLFEQLRELNKQIIHEALVNIEALEYEKTIKMVARIPGQAIFLVVEPSTQHPVSVRNGLQNIFKERIFYAVKKDNIKSMLVSMIGRNVKWKDFGFEKEINVAHCSAQLNAEDCTRLKLAEQVTGIHVIK